MNSLNSGFRAETAQTFNRQDPDSAEPVSRSSSTQQQAGMTKKRKASQRSAGSSVIDPTADVAEPCVPDVVARFALRARAVCCFFVLLYLKCMLCTGAYHTAQS